MMPSKSNKNRLHELANVVNEKGGTPRNVSLSSKKSAKYRNPQGPAKYFDAYNLDEASLGDIKLPEKYVHDELNQEVWDGDVLRRNVLKSLRAIAQNFYEYLKVDVPIEGIWFTGSLANYNWTNFSDIDLHILIDYSKVGDDKEFVFEYLDSKKDNWMNIHNISIKGFDVEVYAQDTNEEHRSTGVYEVKEDEWLRKPSKEKPSINKKSIRKKVKKIVDKLEKLDSLTDNDEIQKKGKEIKNKLKKMRKAGLADVGEFSEENLVFKYLRNNGYIGNLFDSMRDAYDQSLSINEEEKTAAFDYDEDLNVVSSDEVLKMCKDLNRSSKNFDKSGTPEKILKYDKYELKKVPLSSINLDSIEYSKDLKDKYKEMTRINPDYPPIIIDTISRSIIDGKHRAKALQEMGYESIRAYISVPNEISNPEVNESIRMVVRGYINEFFTSAGFHSSIDDWIKKWNKKGVEIDSDSYGDGMDMGFKKGALLSEDEVTATTYSKLSPSEYDVREVEIGKEVEKEHTDNPEEALKIALDHLEERGDYYSQAVSCGLVDEPEALMIYNKYFGENPINESKIDKFYKAPDKLQFENGLEDEHGANVEDFKNFISYCCQKGGIDIPTIIHLRCTRDENIGTTAAYHPSNHHIHIYCKGRHKVDIMRSIAHELMHMIQNLENRLYDNSGDDGSNEENEAHSFSGLMIRKYGKVKPEIYEGYKNKKNLI
tara:strand:+ start:811 stop:2946 length:2136 start_codon:yes stop_codon:yes gene_type:complete